MTRKAEFVACRLDRCKPQAGEGGDSSIEVREWTDLMFRYCGEAGKEKGGGTHGFRRLF